MKSNLHKYYKNKIINKIMLKSYYYSIMQVPRLIKITLNIGIGNSENNKKKINFAMRDLESITGRKPVITKTKKSIAGFKIRKGLPIGCKVTLRRNFMWDFLEKLINIAIPRIRDFRGLSKKSFDGNGNYNFGIKEQIIFPEIDYNKIDCIRGLDINIITNAKNNYEGFKLLSEFNFPFKK
ncbi:50S ribosomal protein L5 [Candidatus Annandia adelgestsuga]|nr:50S ribosomal protein L5 [Candidatus Annandia adelgestsuga]